MGIDHYQWCELKRNQYFSFLLCNTTPTWVRSTNGVLSLSIYPFSSCWLDSWSSSLFHSMTSTSPQSVLGFRDRMKCLGDESGGSPGVFRCRLNMSWCAVSLMSLCGSDGREWRLQSRDRGFNSHWVPPMWKMYERITHFGKKRWLNGVWLSLSVV